MATKILAPINGEVLAWSRRTAGLEPDELAAKADVKLGDLVAFEAGQARPTLPQLERLAKACRRPSAVFFLPEVPAEPPRPDDLRQLPAGTPAAWSAVLRRHLRYVQRRQAWVREVAPDAQPSLGWVGASRLDDDAVATATRLRELLGVPLAQQTRWQEPRTALAAWRSAVEGLGVMVFQTGLRPELVVDVSELRGVALPDPVAPAILLNGSDAWAGRVFSLMHELAHLALGSRAISGWQQPPLDRPAMTQPKQRLEVHCNRVASYLLVPEGDCLDQFHRHGWPLAPDLRAGRVDELTATLSRRYAVSRFVILRRLLDVGYLSPELYREHAERYGQDVRPAEGDESHGGPSPSVVAVNRHGQRFARLVTVAYEEGDISARDFTELLSTGLEHHEALRQQLLRREAR